MTSTDTFESDRNLSQKKELLEIDRMKMNISFRRALLTHEYLTISMQLLLSSNHRSIEKNDLINVVVFIRVIQSKDSFEIDTNIVCVSLLFSDPSGAKFILGRINKTEQYLGTFCTQFGKVCRKEAALRECNDQFVNNIFEFADRERINTTLRQGLQNYASYLSAVEDYHNTLITRIENQILEPLAKYGEVLKIKRHAVQKAISARDKGTERQRKLQQTSARDPNNRDAIVAMQVTAEYAQTEASRATTVLEDEMDKFEEMKLTDLKKYFTDYTLIHLAYHARAIEMYTKAQQQLKTIDIEHDLQEFRTAAPFYQLNPSQRSTSAPALNNLRDTTATTTTTTTGAVSNLVQQYNSTSALDKSSHGGKDLTSGLRVLARQDAPESVSEHSESED